MGSMSPIQVFRRDIFMCRADVSNAANAPFSAASLVLVKSPGSPGCDKVPCISSSLFHHPSLTGLGIAKVMHRGEKYLDAKPNFGTVEVQCRFVLVDTQKNMSKRKLKLLELPVS